MQFKDHFWLVSEITDLLTKKYTEVPENLFKVHLITILDCNIF